jgi:hypothetical protein
MHLDVLCITFANTKQHHSKARVRNGTSLLMWRFLRQREGNNEVSLFAQLQHTNHTSWQWHTQHQFYCIYAQMRNMRENS